jgi:hypothetical protein
LRTTAIDHRQTLAAFPTISFVAQDKVNLSNRFSVDLIDEYARFARARHDFESIRAEICDEDVAVSCKRESIRQGACDKSIGLVVVTRGLIRHALQYQSLGASRSNLHDAASRVRAQSDPSRSASMHSGR